MPWYPYQDLGDGVMRPYLAVWRDPNIRYAAIIDSGADGSSLPLGIADVLGVPFNRGQVHDAGGAGGVYQEFQADEDVTLQCIVGAVTLTRPRINPNLPVILLGRSDAFAQYRFAFNQRDLVFLIEPHPPEPTVT